MLWGPCCTNYSAVIRHSGAINSESCSSGRARSQAPSDFAPGVEISKPLEAVVMQAIAKKSATRFQSTADFISALDTASRPDRLTPMPSPALALRTPRMRPAEPSARIGGPGVATSHHQESGGVVVWTDSHDTWLSIQPSVLAAVMLFAIGVTVLYWPSWVVMTRARLALSLRMPSRRPRTQSSVQEKSLVIESESDDERRAREAAEAQAAADALKRAAERLAEKRKAERARR